MDCILFRYGIPTPLHFHWKVYMAWGINIVDSVIVSIKKDVAELEELTKSIGYDVKKVFIQIREKPTPYYVGRGKMEEIKNFIEENNIELVLVNDALRPSQWFNMEKYLGVTVYDRVRIILEIFADRAKRREGKLQVKLAKLTYEKPFVRELFHRVKKGEKPGFLAGGEYVVADYYEMIKRQTKKIREELKKIALERDIRRMERKESGFYLVSIAGYANAGKSSLLNYLTGEKRVVEDRVFSTLSTKTSRFRENRHPPLLFTDTVGFIKDLPHWMIDAFHSTLEEIALADVVILLIDSSDSTKDMKEKAMSSLKEIYRLKETVKIIVALSKSDLLSEKEIAAKTKEMKRTLNHPCIPISTLTERNMDVLINQVYECLPQFSRLRIEIPQDNADGMLEWLSRKTSVTRISQNNALIVELECSERMKERVVGKCKKSGFAVREYGA
ncbi:MAG: GTPase HflX [Thermoplasmata archaeon]|nr:MAG: GTPase HflX [Thermoplasmata archaeon]